MTEKVEGRRAVSIRDVARLAGVSYQTVSRVLNGGPNIVPATEARVRSAMEELAWRPNTAARTLATSRSHTIGLLVSSRSQYGPSSAAGAVEDAARAVGYTIRSTTLKSSDDETLAAALDSFVVQGVDGIFLIAPQQRAHEALKRVAVDLPFMTLQWREGPDDRVAAFDHFQGARIATRHLIELGHTHIRHLAGPRDWNEAEERRQGFEAEMAEFGLPVTAPAVGDWTAESGYRIGTDLLRDRDFTAVFASNDQMALGLIHAAHDLGVSVPRDLSIVGFDDIPEARHFIPPLTTMRQDFVLLGKRALDFLVADIEGADPPVTEPFPVPHLVVRASTSAPDSAGPR